VTDNGPDDSWHRARENPSLRSPERAGKIVLRSTLERAWLNAERRERLPAVNQIEINHFHQQADAQKLHEKYKIQTEGWAPFAEGQNGIFENETLRAIGAKHGKSVAQVVVRWHLQRKIVVIPKFVKKERMIQNFSVFDFALSDDDMTAINGLDTEKTAFFNHRDSEWVEKLSTRTLDL
jgi:diketogulonate reductase-like aldo/keto reductase